MRFRVGISFAFLLSALMVLALACAGAPAAQPTPTPPPASPTPTPTETPGPSEMVEVLAPIDLVEVRVRWPVAGRIVTEPQSPEYAAYIKSGLPSGCVEFDRYEMERDGDTITITIWNLMPADPNIPCTTIYGIVEHNISLGSDFEPGKTYTVKVNDVTETFVATGLRMPDVEAALGTEFRLGVGQVAVVMPDGLRIMFLEVAEDSRCPANVTCVWAGQARVRLQVSESPAERIGRESLPTSLPWATTRS